jgi:hypothetical protein
MLLRGGRPATTAGFAAEVIVLRQKFGLQVRGQPQDLLAGLDDFCLQRLEWIAHAVAASFPAILHRGGIL